MRYYTSYIQRGGENSEVVSGQASLPTRQTMKKKVMIAIKRTRSTAMSVGILTASPMILSVPEKDSTYINDGSSKTSHVG